MSVFERKVLTKIHIDDTDILVPNIINSELKDGHTEYVIRVQKGYSSEYRWYVHRRYNDFLALHNSLQESGLPLPLPPKKYIGNLDRQFISERQSALQNYLDEILKNPILSESFGIKRFLDPANYKITNNDSSINELQMVIRNEMEIKIFKLLPQLGWRFRKKSYLMSFKGSTKNEFLLQWVPFGPDKYLEDEDILNILKAVTSLQHVNIAKIEKAGIHRGGGYVLHDVKCETLLDVICEVKDAINTCALKKYSNYKTRKPLDSTEVIEISSQILQALAFLQHKGIPYGHLHLGNILLDGNLVKLYGIENTLFGLPCFYRHLLINLKTINSIQAVDVYCFGLSVFEMLSVKSFNFVTKEISLDCPAGLKSVLESILSLRAMKNGLPSVKDLLNLQIFRRPPPNPLPYFKITQLSRDHLDSTATKVVNRIKEDYCKFLDSTTAKVVNKIKEDYCKVREYKKAKAMQKLLAESHILPSIS